MIGILIGRWFKVYYYILNLLAIFNKGEIIEGKINFYLNEDVIAH